MLKKLSNLGVVLNKTELNNVRGGRDKCVLQSTFTYIGVYDTLTIKRYRCKDEETGNYYDATVSSWAPN